MGSIRIKRGCPALLLPLAFAVMACGSSDGVTDPVELPDAAPVIEPYIQYDTILAGNFVELTVTVTDDRRVRELRVDWGDGSPLVTVAVDSARYSARMRHWIGDLEKVLVKFTAIDDAGQEAIAIAVITVLNPPSVQLSYPDTVPVNEPFDIRFDVYALHLIGSVIVDLGDGSAPREYSTYWIKIGGTIIHTYTQPGSYELSIDARDKVGQSTIVRRTIVAIPWPG